MANNHQPRTVYDNDSIAKFGQQANALGWPHSDLLLEFDGDLLKLLRAVLAQQKDDFVGVSSIVVDADQDPVHLFGVLTTMASRGVGTQGCFDVYKVHPSGETLSVNVRMVGCHFNITMEGGQAKMTGELRTVKNTGPTSDTAAAWVTGHAYAAGIFVTDSGVLYVCDVAHTSGSHDDEPGVGAVWDTYWDIA